MDLPTVTKPRRAVWIDNRERILQTARELFSQRGYRGTTTKDLAAAAGIAEPTLFRHFPSKAALFEQAVVSPVQEFLGEFVQRRRERTIGIRDAAEATREFYSELYDELARDSRLLVALVAALTFDESDAELVDHVRPGLRDLLSGLDRHFAREFKERGFGIDSRIGLRIMVGAVLGIVVHGDWLFGDKRRPSRDRLVDELTRLTVYGLAGGPTQT
ncbi:MAG: TetR/AcrR family transcriptional regulator [Solirubrobacteraceae bacterium]